MVSFWYSKDIFFFDMKCLQFLVHVFLDCKLSFRLLWRKYRTVRRMRMRHKACKGHWEFRFTFHSFWQPAQIHIHVQMRLAGTSCASVAGCQAKFQVPLTAFIRHLYFDEPCCYSDKHWKDGFNNNKQKMHFRIVVFCIEREISLWIGVILLQEILSPFRKHLCNQW